MKKLSLLLAPVLFSTQIFAWDGYDYDSSSYIEVESGTLVREGLDIDVYDYESGTYKTYEVDSVDSGSLEVYDYESGEYRSFDMD